MLYKLVSKVLANTLKCILGDIISPNHRAFVPGRLISDNTILPYEMMHFLKRKRTRATSYVALKLDMSKAYDRVNWDFMEKIMTRLGLASAFVEQISKCMHTVRYRFKVNGSCTETVILGQGLRQGDPISPYLFVLRVSPLCLIMKNPWVRLEASK